MACIRITAFAIMFVFSFLCIYSADGSIMVFYKNRKPSLAVLDEVKKAFESTDKDFEIEYLDIEDAKNLPVIADLGLPSGHFPFAVVIDGKYTAKIGDDILSFVHFPLFMKGIGRHEGNWSMDHLKMVLKDSSLLHEINVLPVLEESSHTTSCED